MACRTIRVGVSCGSVVGLDGQAVRPIVKPAEGANYRRPAASLHPPRRRSSAAPRGVARVIFCADLEDCPSHDITADFGLTENTTAQLLFRARRSLESALDARA